MGIIEPKFDASRLKGGSTGLIKSIADRRQKDFIKQQAPILKDLAKQRKAILDAPAKAAKKRSDSAKKGAATRKANREAANKQKPARPLQRRARMASKGLPGTVPGQSGAAQGKPAKVGTQPVVASKPANAPRIPSVKTRRTPPAKPTNRVSKIGPVTKPIQRGRVR